MLGLGLDLDSKIEKAVGNLREYEHEALKRDPRGYRHGDSYGKDSSVVLRLLQMSGVKFFSAHNFTTLDPKELLDFGRKQHPDTIEQRSPCGHSLLGMLAHYKTTLPTRSRRWCCDLFKERKTGLVNVFGIRAYESRRRRRSWKLWTPHISTRDWTLNPILYWTDEDVWNFIRRESVPYCCLYDQGLTRLGCIGCPLNPSSQEKEFARWPGYEKAWKRAIRLFWERLHDAKTQKGEWYYWHTFATPDALWDWWLLNIHKEEDDDCQMGLF